MTEIDCILLLNTMPLCLGVCRLAMCLVLKRVHFGLCTVPFHMNLHTIEAGSHMNLKTTLVVPEDTPSLMKVVK